MLKGCLITVGLGALALTFASCSATPEALIADAIAGKALPAASEAVDATTRAADQAVAKSNQPAVDNTGRVVVVMPTYVYIRMPNGQQVLVPRK